MEFGPKQSRRVGDYSNWIPGAATEITQKDTAQKWGTSYELWRMDLSGLDLGLIEDKVERAVREAYSKYLLLDSKSRRLVLILPSILPHPLISIVLTCLFTNFQVPSLTLFSSPIMSVVAAGVRSGIVVDIGWHETRINAVYEYREVHQSSTVRAMKLTTLYMAMTLQDLARKGARETNLAYQEAALSEDKIDVDLDHAEEVLIRMGWCQSFRRSKRGSTEIIEEQMDDLNIRDRKLNSQETFENTESLVSLPLTSPSSKPAQVLSPTLRKPIESALLDTKPTPHDFDDHEQPIHFLLYNALLSLPPDVRGSCLSRIIITGGGSNIPGLKQRLIDELAAIVKQRGWDPVYGKGADHYRKMQADIARTRNEIASKLKPPIKISENTSGFPNGSSPAAAPAFEPQVPDPIEEKLRREAAKVSKPTVSGIIRGVETSGAWAGASLVAGLRIKGIVEIDRDAFLQHGMAGAKRDAEVSVMQSRQSFGPGIIRAGVPERAGWTLGAWA